MTDTNYKILSCDGGGMRGLTTALLIKRLDEELGILQKVNLFAGTSTGGIIAVLLASGLDIKTIVEIYKNQGEQIFTPYSPSLISSLFDIPRGLFERFVGERIPHLFRVMYDSKGLEKVLRKTPFLSNNPTLQELQRKVLVTTFQLYGEDSQIWRPITLHNIDGSNVDARTKQIHEIPAVDAVLSTSAAPLYFPPHLIKGLGYCVDGGVFANNPCVAAITVLDQHQITPLKNVKVLSIGTGNKSNEGVPEELLKKEGALKWGIFKWTHVTPQKQIPPVPIFELMLDGGTEATTRVSQILLGPERFQRANVPLIDNVPLDGCNKIGVMEASVDKYIETPEWQQVKDWIKTYW